MPFILHLDQQDEPAAESAVAARILSDQAVAIVRQYGPSAVLQATADALTYYAVGVQPGEPMSSRPAYEATADAIAECRRAVGALTREACEYLR